MAVKIALAGNPNSGKTTMFNDLTGSNQYVGNWPGVTVEKKEGALKGDRNIVIQDLPGIYSLSPYTLEEVITRAYLIQEKPDAIINIVDGSNIERNLYLTTQLLELGIPVVIALNMIDVVQKRGDRIDIAKLSEALGCEIVETSAVKGTGSKEVAARAAELARGNKKPVRAPAVFSGSTEHAIAHIEDVISGRVDKAVERWYAIKLFERDPKVRAALALSPDQMARIESAIVTCEEEQDEDCESIITNERYDYISRLVAASVKKKQTLFTASDKIDEIVTNRWLALPLFAVVMFVVYYISVSTVGALVTDFTNDVLFGEWIIPGAAAFFEGLNVAPWLSGLVVDGIIAGVGAVLGFVPQMIVLFFFLAILEDCGYMSRVAFIMDRLFRKFGLSGKSFIPLLIGTGCSVPGIMASRTIENERDRRMTIITTSFIPCSAKMPIIGLFAGAVFGRAWWVAPSAYFVGIAAVVLSGLILKKTRLFAGDPSPFVMELPAYHLPNPATVLNSVWERAWSFIKRAGSVILVASVAIWFLSNFGSTGSGFGMVEDLDHSVLANIGSSFAFIFTPIGFGFWQAAVATILGLIAKEEVVGVFGVLYGVGGALDLVEGGLFGELSGIAAHFTMLSGYCFLLFNLLCAPCFAAMGAIKREMNNWKWTAFAIGYQCTLAYVVSLIVYQLGLFLGGNGFNLWTAVALLLLGGMAYLVLRPEPKGSDSSSLTPKKVPAAVR
ncbi:MAG: ferrous iron transport protein B [Clostridiales bacterium]|nr:ferrous iron transport protein B [Clostridiales bacterium]